MGNVGIASAEDAATAMFYNPAALARTKKAVLEFFNPQLEMGQNVPSLGAGLKDFGKHLNLQKVRPLLEAKPNTASYLGASLYPNVHAQNFNFGILLKAEGVSYVDADDKLIYRSRYLTVPTMGISMGLLGGRFRLGLAARGISLAENDRSTTAAENIGYSLDADQGFGLGLDAGALLALPVATLPTLGFVARNVGDTTFRGSAPATLASGEALPHEKIKMTYDAAFAVFPKFNQRSKITLAADYRDILNMHETDLGRRINFGIELDFHRTFFLRAGMTRGYWTAGLGLASKYGSLDIGTYAEELHRTSFQVLEDRRYSIRYGSHF
jgi:hypothetical protein